ncbi:MAG: malto-oligosyltrehalose trehalohydrolase [Rhizobiaceae bacterium]|nr:malto-oligosyltrehalose trehalohydrolase [Rhizobiaceae bacterium]
MQTTKNTFQQDTSWGTRITPSGAMFRLWAPGADRVELVSEDLPGGTQRYHAMQRLEDGWCEIETDAVPVGGGYGFRINGGQIVPDPAARAQTGDVHSLSRLVDPRAYVWKTADWKGRPWHETVFYELHTGTFTPGGMFDDIVERLDYLADLGITAIELMPIAHFGGKRGWGYDGVLLYAPHEVYGGGEGLKRLVDAAHERGLMVFLDVVYNHFGPDGNYLGAYAPQFFHPEIHTAWGAAIAYEKQPVRDFMIDNALFWLNEYRLDGLRLDAIDSIEDEDHVPLVQELGERVRAEITDRHVHITSEDARNITWHIERDGDDRPKMISGEWNDDFHHCAHVVATHEEEGYYSDYAHNGVAQMARCLAEGFVFQGEMSHHRGHEVGVSSGHLPPTAFVNFIQNHDQIGNRAFGDRLTDLASRRAVECLQAILLLSPQIPLIFMGEEFGDTHPFCFFTDFGGELGEAIREGRRKEFKKFAAFQGEEQRQLIPDPNLETTFRYSTIDWTMKDRPTYRRRLFMVRKLLTLRRERIMPLLTEIPPHCGSFEVSDTRAFVVSWTLRGGRVLKLFANLDDEPWTVPEGVTRTELTSGELIFSHQRDAALDLSQGVLPGPSVVFRLSDMLQIEDLSDE